MKPKYIFYILLLIALHYEIGRLVNCMQPRDADEASYDKGIKFQIALYNAKIMPRHPRLVISVINAGKKKLKHKSRTAGVLYARTYPARAKH